MKFEIPDTKKLVYEMRIPIRWGDMDAMNHVNNTTYFRYLETCRIDWMRSIGCGFWGQSQDPSMKSVSGRNDHPRHEGPVIINAFCNFYKQLEYPGDVLTRMFVSDPKRTTFESWCTMERSDQPGLIYAAGGATTIWVDIPKQKAKALPDWLRQLVS